MSTDHPEDTNHGDTVAAWSSVIVIIIGFIGLTFFFYQKDIPLTWTSIAVIAVGVVLGPVLSALGLGKKK